MNFRRHDPYIWIYKMNYKTNMILIFFFLLQRKHDLQYIFSFFLINLGEIRSIFCKTSGQHTWSVCSWSHVRSKVKYESPKNPILHEGRVQIHCQKTRHHGRFQGKKKLKIGYSMPEVRVKIQMNAKKLALWTISRLRKTENPILHERRV